MDKTVQDMKIEVDTIKKIKITNWGSPETGKPRKEMKNNNYGIWKEN